MKKVIKILAPTLTFIVFAVTINWGYVGLLSKQLIQAATEVASGNGTTSQMLLEELKDFQARDIFNMQVIQKLPFVDSGDGTEEVLPLTQPGDDLLPYIAPGSEDDVIIVDGPSDGNGSNTGRNLYRGMMEDVATAKPKTGDTARTLGARPQVIGADGKIDGDIPIDSDGMVHPGTGGMSVSPAIQDLKPWRRPEKFGGTGKDDVWLINEDKLGEKLVYVPDKPDQKDGKVSHGEIQPAYTMTYEDYQNALAETAQYWEKQ